MARVGRHELAREAGGHTGRYRSQVFAAWHGSDQRLDADSVLGYTAGAGVDADQPDLDWGRRLLGERRRDAVARGLSSTGRGPRAVLALVALRRTVPP